MQRHLALSNRAVYANPLSGNHLEEPEGEVVIQINSHPEARLGAGGPLPGSRGHFFPWGSQYAIFFSPGVSCSNCVDGVFTVGLEEAFSSFAILSPNGHFYKMFHFLNNFYFIEV